MVEKKIRNMFLVTKDEMRNNPLFITICDEEWKIEDADKTILINPENSCLYSLYEAISSYKELPSIYVELYYKTADGCLVTKIFPSVFGGIRIIDNLYDKGGNSFCHRDMVKMK